MQYIVVSSYIQDDFCDQVNQKISEGFELHGTMQVTVLKNNNQGFQSFFYQAMIKK